MNWLDQMKQPTPRARDVFCNRTLNLRSIKAIGYDMDYTLVHYRPEAWELRAYEHAKARLAAASWPVGDFKFDPELVSRGLILDIELGNIVKSNRFGFVKKAIHGTRPLDYEELRRAYARTTVDLSQDRWYFLNTLFSLSEGCLYAQAVDLLDARKLPEVLGYRELIGRIRSSLDAAHMEGELKAEIIADPDRFVVLDPETPLALIDQKRCGKKLLLITNSEWSYTKAILSYALDRYLPEGSTWRTLFDVIIVGSRKPEFFLHRGPLFEVVNEEGLLKPAIAIREGGIFLGGSAGMVEKHLGLKGDEILYVGDHMWGDVRVSKSTLRWRTALVLRELEGEIEALETFAPKQAELDQLMEQKEALERVYFQLRLQLQRLQQRYGPRVDAPIPKVEQEVASIRAQMTALDERISLLAAAAGEVGHGRWGPLMRAGNDKSHLARQVENYADVYTSRVSNFLFRTPQAYLRSRKGSLPHDPLWKAPPSP